MNASKRIGTAEATKDEKGEVQLKGIALSKNFVMSDEQKMGIMAHEMAHLFAMKYIDPKAGHGSQFKKLINDLQKKSDFDIPETESTFLERLQTSLKPKPIIIGKTERGKYLISAFADKTWKEFKEEFIETVRGLYKGGEFLYGKVADDIIERVPKQRKRDKVRTFKLSEDQYKRLKSKLQGK